MDRKEIDNESRNGDHWMEGEISEGGISRCDELGHQSRRVEWRYSVKDDFRPAIGVSSFDIVVERFVLTAMTRVSLGMAKEHLMQLLKEAFFQGDF